MPAFRYFPTDRSGFLLVDDLLVYLGSHLSDRKLIKELEYVPLSPTDDIMVTTPRHLVIRFSIRTGNAWEVKERKEGVLPRKPLDSSPKVKAVMEHLLTLKADEVPGRLTYANSHFVVDLDALAKELNCAVSPVMKAVRCIRRKNPAWPLNA